MTENSSAQNESTSSGGDGMTSDELELARAVVLALNLDMPAEDISPNAPLYGEGLGLDSIDMLEIALVVSRDYGIQLRSDDENNMQIFSSLRSLNQYIQMNRTK